eukprot:maker-scaffold551_size138509-snap-gene-0.19 protein:Tk04327 transcript:maker-scaffold551_size138509-snap-gene-0.19-mRNA-1 annotation:"elongation factor mitochondrial-like"
MWVVGSKLISGGYPRVIQRSFSNSRMRGEKKSYARNPHKSMLNIGTIGATQHGKTTLASVLSLVSHGSYPHVDAKRVEDIDNTNHEQEAKHTAHPSHIELESKKFQICLTDLPGEPTYLKNFLSHITELDGALMLIQANEGVMATTRRHYDFLSHCQVQSILPILNYTHETDLAESQELVSMELKEFMDPALVDQMIAVNLSDSDNNALLLQSALDQLDAITPKPRSEDQPLFWPLQNVGNIPNRGTFIAGHIRDGKVAIGSGIDVFYDGHVIKASVRDLEIQRQKTITLKSGDRGGAFVKLKVERLDVKRGAIGFDRAKTDYRISNIIHVELEDELGALGKSNEVIVHYLTQMIARVRVAEHKSSTATLNYPKPILARIGEPLFIRQHGMVCRARITGID